MSTTVQGYVDRRMVQRVAAGGGTRVVPWWQPEGFGKILPATVSRLAPESGLVVGDLYAEMRVGPALHNANHGALVEGPTIALTPHNVRLRTERGGTLRDEVLAAVARIRARTGGETVVRGEVVSEVLSGATDFQRQSVYKALRRMSGREVGAVVDLEDLGDGLLRLRQHRR